VSLPQKEKEPRDNFPRLFALSFGAAIIAGGFTFYFYASEEGEFCRPCGKPRNRQLARNNMVMPTDNQ
jgi:hypothetical protein